ncbi:hypothetical protein J2T13_002904 [Paenibacillus sp. DS2015]
MKQELGRIPTYLELHLHGNSGSQQYRNEFGSYIGFLHWAELLSYEAWLRDVEKTVMTKSYKMIVLLYMHVQTVRELVGAKRNHDCILSLIVTNSDLTSTAKDEAEKLKVDYWHGGLVERKLQSWGEWQPSNKKVKKI